VTSDPIDASVRAARRMVSIFPTCRFNVLAVTASSRLQHLEVWADSPLPSHAGSICCLQNGSYHTFRSFWTLTTFPDSGVDADRIAFINGVVQMSQAWSLAARHYVICPSLPRAASCSWHHCQA
jgi:hypothetical protein